MTQDVAAARVDLERLCERLEKVESSAPAHYVGATTSWYRNPEGPQASRAIRSLLARVAALEGENIDLKESVVAFAAPHAVIYARDFGLPEGHLNSQHYDLLERCGARMVAFTRSDSQKGGGA